MIRLSVEVKAAIPAGQLKRASELVADTSIPNRQISVALYGWTLRNFNSQGRGADGGQPWAPLAPSTVKRKRKLGKSQPLVISGNLRQSFNPFYDQRYAGVGAQASAFAGARGDYALYLHEGTVNMPSRNLLPTPEVATLVAQKVYGAIVASAVRTMGGS